MRKSIVRDERGSLLPLILGYLALLTAALTVAVSVGQVSTANALLNNMAEEIALRCASSVDQRTYYASGLVAIDPESARAVALGQLAFEHSYILEGILLESVVARGSQVEIGLRAKTRLLTGQWRLLSAHARAEVRVNPVG
ncbi:MAG: hypothetical protein WCJ91_04645 [Actinomycetes bacterium]